VGCFGHRSFAEPALSPSALLRIHVVEGAQDDNLATMTTVGHDGGEENEADREAKMDPRLKIARMTEGGFSFIEAIHFYHFIGQCLIEEIQFFLQFMSLGCFSFGCLVQMQGERSSSSSISFLPFCILCSMGSSINPTDLVTLTTFIPSFFQSG
jgi:hypothetical protein